MWGGGKMVFIPNCCEDENIFKIPERPFTAIFVTSSFKNVVEKNNLKGLIFTKIEE